MANWQAERSRLIERRFVITGKLVLDTPASFSNGEMNGTELVILEDALEKRPLLPGASIAGALRHYLLTREVGYRYLGDVPPEKESEAAKKARQERIKGRYATQLFGESLDIDTERMASRVMVHDAMGAPDSKVTRREGVKIDSRTRTADDGMLFSTQVWEAGTTFDLRFELVLYGADPEHERDADSNNLIYALAASLQALGSGQIPLGGRKHRGYGRAHVEDWHVSYYDMSDPKALSAWLLNQPTDNDEKAFFRNVATVKDKRKRVRIDADFRLLDSLLIRATSQHADQEQLTSREVPVLSGTSLAGALRARAATIANTIDPQQTIVDDLFGKHGADGADDLTASRLTIEEHTIKGGVFNLIQNRVKIDRFTGGAFDTALFRERPLFADGETIVQINLELRYPADDTEQRRSQAQIGLLLLLLKDLWTEDLALGGEQSIGRGRLQGIGARVVLHNLLPDDEELVIMLDADGLVDESKADAAVLEGFVDALWQELEGA